QERTAELAQANEQLKAEIVQRKRAEKKLAFLAEHDVLTGLPNRGCFEERFEEALGHCRRTGEKFALLLIDMDYFKEINDRWGHPAGDAVLKEIALRLSRHTRKVDTVARIGGDEFILLFSQIQGREDVQRLAERIQSALRDPIRIGETNHQVTLSIGAAIYPDDGREIKMLMTRADLALYDAKNLGRDSLQFFQASAHPQNSVLHPRARIH